MKILVAALIALFAMAGRAEAIHFTMNGSSCTADAGTIAAGRHFHSAGTAKHAPTATDQVTLYCPVSWVFTNQFTGLLRILYQDSTTVAGNFVQAQLIKLNPLNGGLSVVASVSSDDPALGCNNTGAVSNCTVEFPDQIDLGAYYYVRVNIVRTSTAHNEVLFGVAVF